MRAVFGVGVCDELKLKIKRENCLRSCFQFSLIKLLY